ncbi:MAG TPA: WHG domain-containing protein [Polyangiaceae bacterium]|jgi:AcrR family transcriptional regulator|nr:WHG domain-containing protein [Polyangiaceae bacterium]
MLRLSTFRAKLGAMARPKAEPAEKSGYHHKNLRRALLDGALALFAERGTLDFTLRELARAAGVTHNAPYRHFESKTDLLVALRAEGFALLTEAEQAALRRAGDSPRDKIKALGEAYVGFALAHPHHFRLVLHDPRGDERGARDPAQESYRLLESAIEEAQRAGQARRDMTARELALAAWAIVHGVATLLASGHLPRGEARVRAYADVVAKVFFDGAGARDAAVTRRGGRSPARTPASTPRRTRRRRRRASSSGSTRRAR